MSIMCRICGQDPSTTCLSCVEEMRRNHRATVTMLEGNFAAGIDHAIKRLREMAAEPLTYRGVALREAADALEVEAQGGAK